MKHIRIISAVLAAAVLLTLTACQKEEGDGSEPAQPGAEAGVAVQTQEVAVDTIATGSDVSGQVVSDGGQESVFVAVQAKCTALYVKEGDIVRAGDLICTLDMTDTLASIETATINYNDTKQSYQDQEALFDSQIALAEQNILDTQKSYQDQQALFDSQIALAEKNVADTQKSYQEQKELLDAQVDLAEKNIRDLEALMAIGAASQVEIDQAKLNLQSLQTTRSSTLAQLESGIQSAKSSLQSVQVSKSSTLTQLESGIQSTRNSIQSLQVSKSSTLTQLESGMRTAQLSIDQLRRTMENIDSRGNVVAPVSGTILSLNVAEGSYAGPTAPVAVIDGPARLEISVSVSEALVPKLQLWDEAEVTVSALDTTMTGVIQEIGDKANLQTRLYSVTIGIEEGVAGLRAGMFVDVSFRTDISADTIVIPTEAILTSNNEQNVFVVEDGKARNVPVRTGLTGDGVTEITEGLQAGDQLVVVGQAYLTDGAPVRIVSGED